MWSAAVRLKTGGGIQVDSNGLYLSNQYETIRISNTDFQRAYNSSEIGACNLHSKTFGIDPYEKYVGYEFQTAPTDAEKLPFDLVLPKYYDGGTVKVQFIYRVADSPAPLPDSTDKIKFGLHSGAYRDNALINQAYGTIVWTTDTISNVTRQYITNEIEMTIANIAAGVNKIRGKIYRDNTVTNNYNGSIYLDELLITFKKLNFID